MPTVGEQLRRAREAQGLSLEQVAERTKLKTAHVLALEEGRAEAFAAPVYYRGALRNYAKILRLDTRPLLSGIEGEMPEEHREQLQPEGAGAEGGLLETVAGALSRVPWRLAVPAFGLALVLVLAFYGYRAWRVREQGRDPEPVSRLGSGLYQPKPGGDTLPLPTNGVPRR